jgi:endonuclease/exonuclease/phosphatase (EEP) superfamily protein YafD
MLISELTDGIRDDLRTLARIGGLETSEVAERLGAALQPALRAHYLTALNLLIQEFNLLDASPLTLNLEGDDVRLVRLVTANAEPNSARIALRLSDELKENIETLATDVGASMNSWIVRTLERSVRDDGPRVPGRSSHQLRGKGRA